MKNTLYTLIVTICALAAAFFYTVVCPPAKTTGRRDEWADPGFRTA